MSWILYTELIVKRWLKLQPSLPIYPTMSPMPVGQNLERQVDSYSYMTLQVECHVSMGCKSAAETTGNI